MATIREKFVSAAKGYIGYGCTIFNELFGMPSGTPWCAEFVSKCAKDAGAANKCIVMSTGAGSIPRESMAKGWGTWLEGHNSVPQSGDIIVFTWNGLGYYPGHDKYFSDHVGIVEKVSGNTVHTIEGNANGTNTSSTVCRKSYSLYSGKINGYYRPNWKLADSSYTEASNSTSSANATANTGKTAIKSIQRWLNSTYGTHCAVDGIYGSETKSAIVGSLQCYLNATYKAGLSVDGIMGAKTKAAIRCISKGATGNYVKLLQSALICRGYDTGGFDGEYGDKTYAAVLSWQSKKGLERDGVAGKETFYSLLK